MEHCFIEGFSPSNHKAIFVKLNLVYKHIGVNVFTAKLADTESIDFCSPSLVEFETVQRQITAQDGECMCTCYKQFIGVRIDVLGKGGRTQNLVNVA